MIEDAEKSMTLHKDSVIIEPTSGNTGIGLAMVCAVKKYRLILTMPESMSIERRKIMASYGAELVLTPKEKGMSGAIEKAKELALITPNSWIPDQFSNPANIDIHVKTTVQEILQDFPSGIDYLITGVGTGGHISACCLVIKKVFPQIKIFAVEPEASPVISGGTPGPHRIQGIGAGFIPDNLMKDILDGVITVSEEEAFTYAKKIPKEEGILVGISSGATLAAIGKKLIDIPSTATVLGFCYDTGERYLSIDNLSFG
jgi:cysteine synthase